MILHISQNSSKYPNKFLPGLKGFVETYLDDFEAHFYLYEGDSSGLDQNDSQQVFIDETFYGIKKYIEFYSLMRKADKIFIHGPFSQATLLILTFERSLLKKVHWVMWGTDLYQQDKDKGSLVEVGVTNFIKNKLKANVIKNLGVLVSFLPEDVELARKLYGATGTYKESFVYPSNICKPLALEKKKGEAIAIIVGNSAYPRNNHLSVFSSIKSLCVTNKYRIKVYVPLSYGGDAVYIQEVLNAGKAMFGDNFVPITSFLSLDEYTSMLNDIDIAINASQRQQSLGNTITLLGVGAKIFMHKNVSQWSFFESLGAVVFDVEKLDIEPLDTATIEHNTKVVSDYFSMETLKKQLNDLFRLA